MLSLVACLALWAGSAHAEGSVTFYPTDKTCGPNTSTPPGQCRADIEWRSGSKTADQTVERRTLLKVYAKAGETILVARERHRQWEYPGIRRQRGHRSDRE